MIDAHSFRKDVIAKAYDRRSWIYDKTVAKSELSYHLQAIKNIDFKPGVSILEVATGPGRVASEIMSKMDPTSHFFGIDVSKKMIDLARLRLQRQGSTNFELRIGDCRKLPWLDEQFDVVYNGYMLDLIPEQDLSQVLEEFYRVLKPGGKLILINMSKENSERSVLESIYQKLPKMLALYLMGNCRPVQLEQLTSSTGFSQVNRRFLGGKHPSEIITATKRSKEDTGN